MIVVIEPGTVMEEVCISHKKRETIILLKHISNENAFLCRYIGERARTKTIPCSLLTNQNLWRVTGRTNIVNKKLFRVLYG